MRAVAKCRSLQAAGRLTSKSRLCPRNSTTLTMAVASQTNTRLKRSN
jgi:hypothetical protein